MSKRISMADIARRLDVSRATVSYVLNDPDTPLVGRAMRERVLAMAREMGYRRNRAAQALAGHRSHLIELCVRRFHPAYYAQLLDAFGEQVQSTPYELHIVNPFVHSQTEWAETHGNWPVDGIIADLQVTGPELLALFERGVPMISMGTDPSTQVDHVRIDLRPAVLEAMRHLTARSRRVAHVSGLVTGPATALPDPRYPAYRQVIREAGLAEELIAIPETEGKASRAAVRESVRNYIAQKGCPDAFFCYNDESAIATLAALRDCDYRVPAEVLLIGCDGIEETAYHHPPISTIQYPFGEVARLSWQFLSRRIAEPDIPLQSATLTARLLLRESSARES